MIFGEGKDEEIKKYVDGVFAKAGFLAVFFSQNDNFARCIVDMVIPPSRHLTIA